MRSIRGWRARLVLILQFYSISTCARIRVLRKRPCTILPRTEKHAVLTVLDAPPLRLKVVPGKDTELKPNNNCDALLVCLNTRVPFVWLAGVFASVLPRRIPAIAGVEREHMHGARRVHHEAQAGARVQLNNGI